MGKGKAMTPKVRAQAFCNGMFAGHADLYRDELEKAFASCETAEREACAKIADGFRDQENVKAEQYGQQMDAGDNEAEFFRQWSDGAAITAGKIAADIRARP